MTHAATGPGQRAARGLATFPHREGQHCASAAFRDLLEFHGLGYSAEPLSEGMVFGLSGGLHFMYAEAPEMSPPLYLGGRSEELERDLCDNLAIELDLRRTDDEDEAWRWVHDEVAAGRPTLVWANIKELDYQDVQMDHTQHDVVVVGLDPEHDAALLADHTFAELQRCSLSSLAAARNSTAFPGPNRHATWVMRFPESLPPLRDVVAGALSTVVRRMRDDESHVYHAGLAGVDAFARAYPSWPERFGEQLPLALRGLRFFVTRAGTGGALFRSLEAEFLREAADEMGDPSLRPVAEEYASLAAAWASLARSLRSARPDESHRAAVASVNDVAQREHRAVALAERWLGG